MSTSKHHLIEAIEKILANSKGEAVIPLATGYVEQLLQIAKLNKTPESHPLEGIEPILLKHGHSLLASDAADCIATRDYQKLAVSREALDEFCRKFARGKDKEKVQKPKAPKRPAWKTVNAVHHAEEDHKAFTQPVEVKGNQARGNS